MQQELSIDKIPEYIISVKNQYDEFEFDVYQYELIGLEQLKAEYPPELITIYPICGECIAYNFFSVRYNSQDTEQNFFLFSYAIYQPYDNNKMFVTVMDFHGLQSLIDPDLYAEIPKIVNEVMVPKVLKTFKLQKTRVWRKRKPRNKQSRYNSHLKIVK